MQSGLAEAKVLKRQDGQEKQDKTPGWSKDNP